MSEKPPTWLRPCFMATTADAPANMTLTEAKAWARGWNAALHHAPTIIRRHGPAVLPTKRMFRRRPAATLNARGEP